LYFRTGLNLVSSTAERRSLAATDKGGRLEEHFHGGLEEPRGGVGLTRMAEPRGGVGTTGMPDQLLYQLVKWCKSLPLFKNILVSF